jgi:cation:H+ antiporter
MQNQFITFSLSLIFLIISANLLLRFIEKFAGRIKISPLIIGATIIAIGTSLPETFVAISSISENAVDISFGDIVGSNIANICLILGLGILLFPIRIGTEKTQRNNIIMLLVTASFVALLFAPSELRKILGIFLILFYFAFLIIETAWGEIGRLKEDKKALAKLSTKKGNPAIYLIGILVSLTGLLISSHYLVAAVIYFSRLFSISEEIIGLSIVALGTSLPELATTIASAMDKDWKVLYGDIQGSNIFNLSVIGAILFMSGKLPTIINLQISLYPLIVLGVTTLTIIYLSRKYEGTHIPRLYGLAYLAIYAFYIAKIYSF